MTFPTTVFGSGVITAPNNITYTSGSSITAGGYRLFIVPKQNLGGAGIDIRFTYTNQFGVIKTTTITTSIAAYTTTGTHIQVVLEPGDVGIQSLINVTVIGGSTGDQLSFESWNEGSGRIPMPISRTYFDRSAPGAFLTDPIFFTNIYMKLIGTKVSIPVFYPLPMPRISVPFPLTRSQKIDNLPEISVQRGIYSRNIDKKRGNRTDWMSEPYNIRTFTGRTILAFKSWLESVVGQVTSGYVTNIKGESIKSAVSLIMISTAPSSQYPQGVTMATPVNPITGLYQAFLKQVIYDNRYIIVKVGLKNVALGGTGTPPVIDATKTLAIPYNLQFACPTIDCEFNVTRKVI